MPSPTTRTASLYATAGALLTACAPKPLATPSTMLPPRSVSEPDRGQPIIAAWASSGMSIDRAAFAELIEREITGLARPRRFDGPPCPRSRRNHSFQVFIWSDGTIAYDDSRDIPWEFYRTAHVSPAEVDRVMRELREGGLFDFPPRSAVYSPIPDGSVCVVAAYTPMQTGVAFTGGEYASEWEANRYRQITTHAMLVINRLLDSACPGDDTIPTGSLPAMYQLPGALRRDTPVTP